MSRRRVVKWSSLTVGALLIALAGAAGVITRMKAHELISNPMATRHRSRKTPADYQLPFEDVSVTSADGLHLVGWFIPSDNGAVVIVQHGYKASRDQMLNVAALLHRHGFGVLVDAVRAHDGSDGEMISFGQYEMQDLDAFFADVAERKTVDPRRIGIFGASMGGAMALRYAAINPRIRGVVADCAFSSVADTIDTSVKYFTGLPAFPFAPMIVFWTDRETGVRIGDLDTARWIGRISPRPILLMQGGADQVISPGSGERLFRAAGEPKELWFDPAIGHVQFLDKHPEEFERRVTGFFDRVLAR